MFYPVYWICKEGPNLIRSTTLSKAAMEPHPDSYPMGTGGSLEVKRPGREADHSAEVKNAWNYILSLTQYIFA